MSLNLGTLSGFLELDASQFDGALDEAEGKMSAFGGKGAALAAAGGLAIGGALAAGVLAAMNVEAANDKLSAQLGLTATESERIGGVAGNLYANAYGGSLEEVNTAVGAVISSIGGMRDASSADVEAMSAKMLDLSTTMDVDVTRAAQVAGQMISSGLAKDGAEAMDLLTASMQAVPAAVRGDLLDAVDEYGPFMESIGVTGEQAFGLLTTAAEKGMFGIDKTGDALKEFTIRATDMSAASKVGYDELGLSQEEMTVALLAGGETAAGAFEQIVTGLQGIEDPAAQSQAALALFGTPLEDLSVTEIPQFLAGLTSAETALDGTAGAADRMGATLNDNASTNLESFKRQVTTTFVDFVGGKALPVVNDMASALSTNFGPALSAVTGFLGEHEGSVKVVSGALGAMALVLGAVWLATTLQTLATGALNAVMALNPFVAVALVLAALVAGLVIAYNESETFRDIVDGAFSLVKRSAGNAVGVMIDAFKMLLTVWLTTADGIVSGAATALGWIPGLGGKLKAANAAFDTMKDGILDTLDDAAQAAYGFGEDSGTNVASGLSSTKTKAFNAGVVVANDLGRGVGTGTGLAFNAGANAGQGLVNGLNSKAGAVAAAAQRLAITAGRAMRSGLQEQSPSRVTREIGMYAGEGLRLGLLDTVDAVDGASRLLAVAATPDLMGQSIAFPAGAGVRGGDGASAPGGGDLSALVDELRVLGDRVEAGLAQQTRRTVQFAGTSKDPI